MSPKSAESICLKCHIRELKRFGLLPTILLLFLSPALATTHIVVSPSLPAGTASQPYSAQIGISGGSAPFQFVINAGNLPQGLSLAASTGAISGTPTTSGNYRFHVDVTGSAGAAHGDQWIALKVVNGNVSVTVSPSSSSINSGATQQFTAYVTGTSNTAVTWSASKGTISTSGMFSAPSVSATISATVTATSVASPQKKGSATVTITPITSLTITTTSLPGADTGIPYAAALSATGGTLPYTWNISSGALPSGITLDGSTGVFSGIASKLGTYSFTAKVTDAQAATAVQSFNIVVTSGSGSSFDGPAELPRVYVQSTMASTPSPGTTINVPAGGDFQAALNSANCGDTIQLQAGATFVGSYQFPAKACDNAHWITVRTSAPNSSLPPEGTRMTPCYAGVTSLPGRPAYSCASASNVLARIIPATVAAPITLNGGANHYRLLGLEITRPTGTGAVVALIAPAAAADHIILDRVWLHGTTHDDTRRGFYMSGIVNAAVVDSYLNDFHCAVKSACIDAQTVAGGSGTIPSGQWKILNNFLEASGENILFGGSAGTITPTDIEIRRNHFFKPWLWMPGVTGFIGGTSGSPFVVKNHFEIKNAQRVLFEANILENNWGGFTQHGFAIVLSPRAQGGPKGSATNPCSTCQVTDITIRYNTISHTGAGMSIGNPMSGLFQALYGERYSIHDITIDDISMARKGTGTLFLVYNNWPTNMLNSVSINHVTGFPDPLSSVLRLGDPIGYSKMWGFMFTNNIASTGAFPVWTIGPSNCVVSTSPLAILPSCFSSYSFASNALVATPSSYPSTKWPSGNYFPANAAAVQFVNYNNGIGGNYQLLTSSPYKNAATDGKDLGADIAAIQAATAGVY